MKKYNLVMGLAMVFVFFCTWAVGDFSVIQKMLLSVVDLSMMCYFYKEYKQNK